MKRMRKKNFDLKEGTMIYRQNGENMKCLDITNIIEIMNA